MKAINIKWDTEGDIELLKQLPTEITIPENMIDEERISDYLSDKTGFCHYGFNLVDQKEGGRYYVTIWNKCKREILKRTVIVEAESFEEAMQKVIAAVERDEIILDADDYEDREIVPSEYWDDGKVPDGEDVSFYYLVKEKNTSIKNAIFISVWDYGIRVHVK